MCVVFLTSLCLRSIVAESTFFETKEIREQILDTKDPVVPPIVLVGNKVGAGVGCDAVVLTGSPSWTWPMSAL